MRTSSLTLNGRPILSEVPTCMPHQFYLYTIFLVVFIANRTHFVALRLAGSIDEEQPPRRRRLAHRLKCGESVMMVEMTTASPPNFLIVPGLNNSVALHWQTLWQHLLHNPSRTKLGD
jgi:hypothetical protein